MTACLPRNSDLILLKKNWIKSQKEFNFKDVLLESRYEEEVKAAFVKYFSLPFKKACNGHDLTVGKIFFEFKNDVDLDNRKQRAKVVAQALYYLKSHWDSEGEEGMSHFVVADKNEAAIFYSRDFTEFYKNEKYKWKEFTASKPSRQLVEDLCARSFIINNCKIYKLSHKDELDDFSENLYNLLLSAGVVETPDCIDSLEEEVAEESSGSQSGFFKAQLTGFVVGFMAVMAIAVTAAVSYQVGTRSSSQVPSPVLLEE